MTEPELNKEQEEELAKMFMTELEEARELISAEGGDIGMCPHCMDTGYIFMEKDGYTGIQARIENEVKQFNECFHGAAAVDTELGF